MTRDDHDDIDPELVELALKLRALERDDPEEDNLFPDSFMQEFTDFQTWDEFRVHLAATPRPEREAFVTRTTRFASYEVMERKALEQLRAKSDEARQGR
jgi:hypothetical protein